MSVTDGWLMCGGQPGAGHQWKSLYRTTDSGDSWQEVTSSPDPRDATAQDLSTGGYLQSFFFVDDQHGWVSSGRFPCGFVQHTSDGGQTWESVRDNVGNLGVKRRLHFISPSLGTMIMRVDNDETAPRGMTMRYVLLRTTDGGWTWEQIFPHE